MRGYNLVITQIIILLAVTDRLLSGNTLLKRVSGTVRAGSVAKSDICASQGDHYITLKSCRQSITVLKTDYLHESVSQILEKAISTQCPKECALLCFQAKCKIAHFDSSKKICHFKQNTVPQLTVCNRIWLIEQLRNNASEPMVGFHSFCVFCAYKKSRFSTISK
ncbi:PAN domain family protein [Acanthocheilonema viteae]